MAEEKRSGGDRRSGSDRRAGKDRRAGDAGPPSSQAKAMPVASNTPTVASLSSGPIPSPGIRVTV